MRRTPNEEILPAVINGWVGQIAVQERDALLQTAREFLHECFHVPRAPRLVRSADCPSLPFILSLIRQAIVDDKPLSHWHGDGLTTVLRAIEYGVFAAIEASLLHGTGSLHYDLLSPLYDAGIEPTVISLNYDVLVDNVMFDLGEGEQRGFPKYGAEISSRVLSDNRYGVLLKLHGSLNWMHCPKCGQLELFVTEGMRTAKALHVLYRRTEEDQFLTAARRCRTRGCSGVYEPLLLAPSFRKNYGNVHLDSVWTQAGEALRRADRAVIIGYSLPTDDVEVGLLLKTCLDHLDPSQITVVEYTDPGRPETRLIEENPVGRRFRSLLGRGIDWQPHGLEGWLRGAVSWTER